jgi:hypothetical protein
MTYEIIRKNFFKKLWNATQVKVAVTKGVIKPEQFNTIMHDGVDTGVITPEEYTTHTGLTYTA